MCVDPPRAVERASDSDAGGVPSKYDGCGVSGHFHFFSEEGSRIYFEARQRSEVQQGFDIAAVSEAACGAIEVWGSCRSPVIL